MNFQGFKLFKLTETQLTRILLIIILLSAALLRFWKFDQIPFMHDEFSALLRTDFDNFSDLIKNGVCVDAHPAGVQVFLYYWVRLFGWSEFWIKLPFALMGLASVYLVFYIGRQWFGNATGLLASAFFAVSQYTVFYSQLARPYSAGLFFVLLFVVFWNKMLFQQQIPTLVTCIGFAVSAWLAALMHNFAIAQAGLIFLTGLFFLKKERAKTYWLCGLAALLLFAPNLPIFYQQLFVNGGIGAWLGEPKSTFILDFLYYTVNHSKAMLFVVLVVALLPLLISKSFYIGKWKLQLAILLWFMVPFVMAYVYSLLREPILQYSTLYFCFPFLLLLLFSFEGANTLSHLQLGLSVVAILLFGSSSLTFGRHYYDLVYHQGYDQIASLMKSDSQKNSNDLALITVSDNVNQVRFYQQKEGLDEVKNYDFDTDFPAYFEQLSQINTNTLELGWTDYADPKWEMQAVSRFPYLCHSRTWFNSKCLLLSRTETDSAEYLLHGFNDFEAPINMENIEWGQSFTFNVADLAPNTDFFAVTSDIIVDTNATGCLLVLELHNAADSLLLWRSSDAASVLRQGHNKLSVGIRLDEFDPTGLQFKTYLWNRNKEAVLIENMSWYAPIRHPYFHGLFEPMNY